ncbi:MAG: fluoride efflux transporter CrcB [Prosthecochloris sp.]|nr:fluoride efflux transporter CrcB [Prosthecochloris sp.]
MQGRYAEVLLVGVGGFAGAAARYLVAVALSAAVSGFPFATLLVNLLGCFLIGAISQLSFTTSLVAPEIRLLLATGFCGGFTTFSSFANETAIMLRSGELFYAAAYISGSFFGGMICLYLGIALARSFVP